MNKLIMILVAAMVVTGCTTNNYMYRAYHEYRHESAPVVYQPPAPQVMPAPVPAIQTPVINVLAPAIPAGRTFYNPRVEQYGRGRQTIFHTRSEPAARVYYHRVETVPMAAGNVQMLDASSIEY